MNAKQVLNRIVTMLSLDKDVQFVDAKTADGTILQSPTFDLGETVEVVSEDGTKSPAPDGEHEIALKDTEGNEVIIRVVTKDGKIIERENVEEATPEVESETETEMAKEDETTVKAEPLPGDPIKEDEVKFAGVAEASGAYGANPEDETPGVIPATDDKPEMDMGMLVSKFEELTFRITELEKALETKMAEIEIEIDGEEKEEEELPKLDGAPIEANQMFSKQENQKRYGKKEGNAQNTFLSKLYK